MNCNKAKQNLIGYLEQTIPIDLQDAMSAHFSECPACRKLYKDVAATYNVLVNEPVPEVNPFFYTRLEQKLRTKYQPQQRVTPRIIWKLQPIAATLLIIIGVGIGIVIGSSISGSGVSLSKPNRSEVLKTYATDYNLTYTGEESISVLANNE
jgi:Predicted integral membrane protein